ncbi:dihydropteroate synthase [Corynebacterium appendicis CIP 107643]|uniref:Dihydropteroate synthase n=1 Tax=Corynebacterium appendicis CIP 107643 TaxID=1161099 RepID=A0A1N7K519_9CORY|nr:dihydropteroate synthase [Corynebacterium appendicis]WJY60816.1 Inactive dihydropteroate synthase 2 [Corynebacterium appendicis CIP 107643]SIS56647.1 dihydropteroate synthase [Corynebacterium appendicis CIP 107643]
MGTLIDAHPRVMAIINRTPDSFYDKGATFAFDAALARCREVVEAGATIVDVGGVKAGPGDDVDVQEEIERVVPFIAAVRDELAAAATASASAHTTATAATTATSETAPVAAEPSSANAARTVDISVDTWRPEVAEAAIQAGATLINDTWAGFEPELVEVAGAHKVGYVCSHTGGATPRTRPHRVHYDDVVADVIRETTALAESAVACGVPEEKVFIDPTHDFGKNTFHGLEILRRIDEVVATGWPVLMALSNKDFIGETTGRGVGERVAGTLAATAWCAARGVAAFRVHEVAETLDAIRMTQAIQGTATPLDTIRGLA